MTGATQPPTDSYVKKSKTRPPVLGPWRSHIDRRLLNPTAGADCFPSQGERVPPSYQALAPPLRRSVVGCCPALSSFQPGCRFVCSLSVLWTRPACGAFQNRFNSPERGPEDLLRVPALFRTGQAKQPGQRDSRKRSSVHLIVWFAPCCGLPLYPLDKFSSGSWLAGLPACVRGSALRWKCLPVTQPLWAWLRCGYSAVEGLAHATGPLATRAQIARVLRCRADCCL